MTAQPKPPSRDASGARTDENLGRIVRLLAQHSMYTVSGTHIAEEIGTSRSEVWRLIEQLRVMGVKISGHPSDGYLIEEVPDLLLPELLDPIVAGTIFHRRMQHYFRIGSTNTRGMQVAAEGAEEGTCILGEEQVAGRGRGGHSWSSEPGVGIYCSSVLRPSLSPADVLVISLMAGLAVVQAVEQVTGIRADLRWPNDVLIGERKFCGILTELNAELTRVRYLVVGIGINVNQGSFAPELSSIATSLAIEGGRKWSRVELTAALLKSLDSEYRQLLRGVSDARQDIFRRFTERSTYVRDTKVHVEEDGGYHGTTDGLDERGFLRVKTASGTRTVLSGGVRKVP